jgi:hypothetical protein
MLAVCYRDISFSLSELTKPSRRKRGGEGLPPDVLAKLADLKITEHVERVFRDRGQSEADPVISLRMRSHGVPTAPRTTRVIFSTY